MHVFRDPAIREARGRPRWEGKFKSCFQAALYPTPSLPARILVRVRRHFAPSFAWEGTEDATMELLRFAPPAWAQIALRSWLGSWVTSRRMARLDAQCIFGCDAPDNVNHYICSCRRLQYVASMALHSFLPGDPLFLLGLRGGSLAFVVACYHTHRLASHQSSLPLSLSQANQLIDAVRLATRLPTRRRQRHLLCRAFLDSIVEQARPE